MTAVSGFSISSSLVVCAAFLAAAAHAGDNAFTVLGPEGGGLLDVALHPTASNVAYAATPSGLYRSSDGGSSWTLAKGDFLVDPFDIAVDPATPERFYVAALEEAYVGLDDGAQFSRVFVQRTGQLTRVATSRDGGVVYLLDGARLHRSSDHGSTWASGTAFPFPGSGIAFGLAVHPTDPSTVWVGVFGNGILLTRDGGLTWQVQSTDPNLLQTLRLEVDPTNPDCLWASTTLGLYRSLDQGVTWEASGPSGWYTDLDLDPSGEIYATESSSTVIHSTDGGAHWTALPIRFGASSWPGIAIDPQDRQRLVGFGGTGVWLSANSGATWLRGNTGLRSSWITALARVEGTTRVYLATGENGAHRVEAPDRIAALNNSALAAATTNVQFGLTNIVAAPGAGGLDIVFALTTAGELVRSLDGGTSWTRLSLPRASAIALSSGAPRRLYAVSDTIRTSTDFGNTWIPTGAGLPDEASVPSIAVSSDPLVAYLLVEKAGEYSVFKTNDGAQSWQPAAAVPGTGAVFGLAVDSRDPQRLYVGRDSGITRSLDGGATWSALAGPANVGRFAFDARRTNVVYAASDQSLLRSLDAGATWDRLSATQNFYSGHSVIAVDPYHEDSLLVGSFGMSLRQFSLRPDLELIVTGSTSTVQNSPWPFTVRAHNLGSYRVANVRVTIDLSAGASNVTASTSNGTCTVNALRVTCSYGSLDGGASAEIALTASSSTVGTLSVSGTVTSDDIDAASANDSATFSATVTAAPAPRGGGGGGGGGAISFFLLLALGLAGASRRALC